MAYLAPFAIFAVLCGAFLWQIFRMTRGEMPNDIPTVMIDRPAPDFSLASAYENRPSVSRADYAGKVVLVNFFASWCVPCRSEHALLGRLARNVTLVGLVYRDSPEAIRRYLAQLGDPYAAVGMVGDGSSAAIDFGLTGVPESYLIDKQGRVRYAWKRPFTAEEIRNTLLPLVAELNK
jgi:DsbE subfamily thiol:disulfide oxidoreductase